MSWFKVSVTHGRRRQLTVKYVFFDGKRPSALWRREQFDEFADGWETASGTVRKVKKLPEKVRAEMIADFKRERARVNRMLKALGA